MNTIKGYAIRLLVLPVLATTPLTFHGADEHEAVQKEIKKITIEAREAAKEWANKIREWNSGEETKSNYIGVVIESVPSVLRDYVDLPKGVGLLLPKVTKDGPAEKAGLQDNDILVKFDGQLVINHSQLSTLINMKEPGDSVPVTILRKGEELEFEVILEERVRKGIRFLHPDHPAPVAPVPPVHPGEDVGAIMERIDEWIPGSVRVFIDEDEKVHVDVEDLKNDLKGLRTKLRRIHVLDDTDVDHIVMKHGDAGARTTTVHISDKDLTYVSDDGKVEMNSTSNGKQVKVWDENEEVIYEGLLPENYAEVLPAKAVQLIDALESIQLETHEDHIEVELHTDVAEPVTMLGHPHE